MYLRLLFIALLSIGGTLTGAAHVEAAQVALAGTDVPGCDKIRGEEICLALSLVGKIEAGDTRKLQQEVARVQGVISTHIAKARVALVFLESPGGNMNEAMSLGRFLRANQVSTHVAHGDTCASACVLVLAAGVKRLPAGDVVVHSFYSPEVLGTNDFAKAEKAYERMSAAVALYLREMRVSGQLLDEMIRVPHFTSRKLELEELVRLGLLGIDPVYAQARRVPRSPTPRAN